ncbi:hypothetical protein [Microbacterium sp. che218]|uniref:hypothetical protein n=1 Tax=Microbacterium sp. che218 TaxID=3140649 RepID=UPI0033684710
MAQTDAREFLINVIDRAAATGRPFWDATPEERAAVRERFGTPAAAIRVARQPCDDGQAVVAADLFLSTAILVEVAVDLLVDNGGGRSRQEATEALRQRVRALLG